MNLDGMCVDQVEVGTYKEYINNFTFDWSWEAERIGWNKRKNK